MQLRANSPPVFKKKGAIVYKIVFEQYGKFVIDVEAEDPAHRFVELDEECWTKREKAYKTSEAFDVALNHLSSRSYIKILFAGKID